MLRATTACTFSTSAKSGPDLVCFVHFDFEMWHFFDISTAKSGAGLVCFVHFDFEMCFAPQPRALFRHLPKVVRTWCALYILTSKCGTFSTSQLPKVVRTWCALYILTSKCASRHNAVHFFDISTAKSGPDLVCFVYFDFEMCFAPQRRALFRHLNFQSWCALYILTSKCASHHNPVHFFDICQKWSGPGVLCTLWHFFDISTAKSGPDLVCFVYFDFEMCFAPQPRALFRHLNCQKWCGPGVLCAF